MANSYTQMYVHITFHVKGDNAIGTADMPSLYKYITGTIKAMHGDSIAIGGVASHVHILATLPKTMTLSDFVMKIKANSSRWMKERGSQYRAFAWQDGYGAFSVSSSVVPSVVAYINNQAEHHKKVSYKEEVIAFFKAYNIEYDEKYI